MRLICFMVLLVLTLPTSLLVAQGPRVSSPPDEANVRYGPHERHTLDLWQAPGVAPSPVVVYFHAGGFVGGDKRDLPQALLDACRRRGFSVVSANYRFSTHNPYPGPMLDGGRAIQYVRRQSKIWKLNANRLVVSGRSASVPVLQ